MQFDQPKSGNAAAKLERAKLLAASALAAYRGYYQNISFLGISSLERLDEALWQPHGPLRSRWMITHAFDKERENSAKDKDIPVCCRVSSTSDMHTLLCSAWIWLTRDRKCH